MAHLRLRDEPSAGNVLQGCATSRKAPGPAGGAGVWRPSPGDLSGISVPPARRGRISPNGTIAGATVADVGRVLGAGRDVEILDLGMGKVLRRPRHPRSLEREAFVMRYVRGAGFPVPEVLEIRDEGLVMERLEGVTMLDDLLAHPWRLRRHANGLAQLHHRLHSIPAVEGLRDRYGPAAPGDVVVHGDLHPNNVLLTRSGPVVIDWANAGRGPGAADVADMWLMLACGDSGLNGVRRFLVEAARRPFLTAFLAAAGREEAARYLAAAATWRARDEALHAAERAAIWRLVEKHGTHPDGRASGVTRFRFPFPSPVPVAHMGSHGPGREKNSLAALTRALSLSVPCLEFDVSALGDGTLVLCHESVLELDGRYQPLRLLRSADIERLPVSAEGSPLDLALDVLAGGDCLIVLDWKPRDALGRLAAVGERLRRRGLAERTLVSTGEVASLIEVKRLVPGIATGLSVAVDSPDPVRDRWAELVESAHADAVMLDRRFKDLPARIARARELGRGVFVWTAIEDWQFAALQALRPDGIMTDAIERHLPLIPRPPGKDDMEGTSV